MAKEFKIIPAGFDDAAEIVALVNKAYRGESSKKGWTTEADLLGGIRTDKGSVEEILNDPYSTLLKCVDDTNKIIGCAHLQKNKQKLYVGMLTVDPDIQNKGMGKCLLHKADLYARKEGLCIIYMTVISIRKELVEWYERHGYRKTGQTQPFPMEEKFGIPTRHLEFIVLEKTV